MVVAYGLRASLPGFWLEHHRAGSVELEVEVHDGAEVSPVGQVSLEPQVVARLRDRKRAVPMLTTASGGADAVSENWAIAQ
jgi:hypothetical protein